jgi:hypothetical protein
VDLLGHEVAVVALADQEAPDSGGLADLALDLAVRTVETVGAARRAHHPVAVLQIGDAVGEGRQRQGVGAEIHLAVAIAHGQRRCPCARRSAGRGLALEQDGEREGAAQARHRRCHRLSGAGCALEIMGDQMGDDLGVGVGVEDVALGLQLGLQLAEILDDAVVDDRDPAVACGWALRSVGAPWVAQRVWPMPIVPASGSSQSRASRLFSLPSARRRSMWPSTSVAMPAES